MLETGKEECVVWEKGSDTVGMYAEHFPLVMSSNHLNRPVGKYY